MIEEYDAFPHIIHGCEVLPPGGHVGAATEPDPAWRPHSCAAARRAARLRRLNNAKTLRERTLSEIAAAVRRLCAQLCVPPRAADRAVEYALRLARRHLGRVGRHYNATHIIAAAVLAVIREARIPIRYRRIIDALPSVYPRAAKRPRMPRVVRLVREVSPEAARPIRPEEHVLRIARHPAVLEALRRAAGTPEALAARVARTAVRLIREARPKNRRPASIAAAAVYAAEKIIAVEEGYRPAITYRVLEQAAGVCESTIRDVYAAFFRPLVIREQEKILRRLAGGESDA